MISEKLYRVSWSRWLLLFLPLVLLVPIFIIPSVLLLANSIGWGGDWLHNYKTLLHSELAIRTIIRSIEIAGIVTVLSLVIGLPYAAIAVNAPPIFRKLLIAAVIATLFFSVIIRAYAWLVLLAHNALIPQLLNDIGIGSPRLTLANNLYGVIIGMVQYGVPFMVMAIYDIYRRLDRKLILAASICGANGFTRYTKVVLPLIWPGITCGVIIVFTVTLGYYVIPQILGSPQDRMIGQLISSHIGKLHNIGRASALSCVMILVSIIAFYLYQRANMRARRIFDM